MKRHGSSTLIIDPSHRDGSSALMGLAPVVATKHTEQKREKTFASSLYNKKDFIESYRTKRVKIDTIAETKWLMAPAANPFQTA